jgi:hypothetical protein
MFPGPGGEIQIHPRTADLAIATHGRSIAVLDDTIPFRGIHAEICSKAGPLFSVRSVTALIFSRLCGTRTAKGFIAAKIRLRRPVYGFGYASSRATRLKSP